MVRPEISSIGPASFQSLQSHTLSFLPLFLRESLSGSMKQHTRTLYSRPFLVEPRGPTMGGSDGTARTPNQTYIVANALVSMDLPHGPTGWTGGGTARDTPKFFFSRTPLIFLMVQPEL